MRQILSLLAAFSFVCSSFGQALYSDADLKTSTAVRILQNYGLSVSPERSTLVDLLELESRLSTCVRIQRNYGLRFDYRAASALSLLDVESRLAVSRRLAQNYGLDFDYRTSTTLDMLDVESRVSVAQRINQRYGTDFDWQQHTALDLLEQESKFATARRAQSIVASTPSSLSNPDYASSAYSAYPARTVAPTTTAPFSTAYTGRYYDYNYRPSVGDHYVKGYTRRDGTFVQGHQQTNPDDSFWNNYSSSGNINPYTGRVGTKLPPSGYSAGSSYVAGYTKRDGTYVSGHLRKK